MINELIDKRYIACFGHELGFRWIKLQQMNEFTNMYSYLKVISQTNRPTGITKYIATTIIKT